MNRLAIKTSLLLILMLGGCSQAPTEPSPTSTPPTTDSSTDGGLKASPEARNYAVVRTYFATDRNQTGDDYPMEVFGADRDELSYGVAEVSIPRDHKMGELESPSIWRLEFRGNPEKHVMLLDVNLSSPDTFFNELKRKVVDSEGRNSFLFIHGYNVTFEDAARRTAQMHYDLGFDGAPVFYSWPSKGKTSAYTVDEASIKRSKIKLKIFLEQYFQRSGADNVYLIAHSMGNRALTRALSELLNEKPELTERLTEVVLTAPDIDAEVFQDELAPKLISSGAPVTLYASSRDLALIASKKVHGYARAGEAGEDLLIIPGIETIDATSTNTSLVGHSYYADSCSVLSDLFNLVQNGHRASRRFGLEAVDTEEGRYWRFR